MGQWRLILTQLSVLLCIMFVAYGPVEADRDIAKFVFVACGPVKADPNVAKCVVMYSVCSVWAGGG